MMITRGRVRAGEKVVILGATGGVGSCCVQLAKSAGAEVIATGSAAWKLDKLVEIGADHVVDYTEEDFRTRADAYDVIFDTVGKSSFSECRDSLRQGGVYVPTTFTPESVARSLLPRARHSKGVIIGMSVEKTESLEFVRALIEAGKLQIVISRRYPLAQLAEAHRYVDTGHKRGNVVITLADE